MSRLSDLGHKLYSGEVSYDIVGRRRRWYAISGVIVLVALLSLGIRGLNLGIEFTGGAEFQVPSTSCTIEQARAAVEEAGVEPVTVTQLGNESIRVTTESVDQGESLKIRQSLAQACGVTTDDVSAQLVGPTWGGEITKKALTALAVFLGLLSIFLAVYFDWRMAVAALVALVHDILITVGVYSILQFEVTPSTVIGILTILGYSLYDTVVVFDKVKENTRGILGQSRQSYSDAANLAVNQTLVRSINTSIVALLPVASILVVGAGLLGAGTLKDLSLALFVGMAAGTYSSIFIATPFLCQLMERDPQMQALARRVQSRGSGATARGKAAAQADKAVTPSPTDAGQVAVDEPADPGRDDAMERARARRASGPRNQPKRTPRSHR
jgi:preprotein translocase subunit SecF